jgi:hypothetical protein
MTNIKIVCPTCKNKGQLNVVEDIMKNITRGLLAINVAAGTICSHNFFVYVDKNYDIRDYFVADFKVEVPEKRIDKNSLKSMKMLDKEIVDMDLIRLFLPATTLTFILKSITSKKKVALISNQDFLRDHIINFIQYITQNSFKADVILISDEDYSKNRKKYNKEYMVFKETKIINNFDKLIDAKKLKIEEQLVNRFLKNTELALSYILLKNDITIAYELCKDIIEIVQNHSGDVKLGKKELIEAIEKKEGFKISFVYLEFLLDIIKNYFEFNLSSVSDYFIPGLGL